MICYKDEKIYVSADNMKTAEQLDDEINELEMKIYGRTFSNEDVPKKVNMIYDVQQDKLVERK